MPAKKAAPKKTPATPPKKGWQTSYKTVSVFRRWSVVIGIATAFLGWGYVEWQTNKREDEISSKVEERLQIQTVARSELIRLWTDNLVSIGLNLVEADLTRLYAGEINSGTLGEGGTDMSAALAAQKPYMEHTINEFTVDYELVASYMLDAKNNVYLQSEEAPSLTETQRNASQAVLTSGATSTLPVREEDGLVVIDIVRPIFKLSDTDAQPIVASTLITTHDITKDIARVLEANPLDRPGERFSLVQMNVNSTLAKVDAGGLTNWNNLTPGTLYTQAESEDSVTSPLDQSSVFMQTQRVKNTPFIMLGEYEARRVNDLLASEHTAIKANAALLVLLIAMALMLAVWFVLRRYNDQRTKLQEQTMELLVRAMEIRDPYLAGHHKRMSGIALKMANKLDLPVSDRATLYYAALLSGIGSIFVPMEILNKPGKLTAKERKALEAHVDHAARVLTDVEFDLPIKPVIMEMYERLDGSGYPRKIKGAKINQLSRILGLSDVYCALTSPRAYREALDKKDAFTILQKDAPKFDKKLLALLKELED